jgi:ferredoxin--NADP+ reductase
MQRRRAKTKYCEAELIEREDFSEDLAAFKFRVDQELTFIPGQYATIGFQVGEKIVQRPYSIVSSPHEPFMEVFVELVPEGVTTPLFWELKLGDSVLVRDRLVGRFVLDEESGMTRHLMAGTVTGAAPYISIVRTQKIELERGKTSPHQFLIIVGASRSWELGYYMDELNELAQSEDWLTFIPTVSRPWEDTEWTGETGRAEDVIRKYGDNLRFDHSNAVVYACGHPQMIENAKSIWARGRFPKERIKEEKFFVIKEE